jgi:hypothetical protein
MENISIRVYMKSLTSQKVQQRSLHGGSKGAIVLPLLWYGGLAVGGALSLTVFKEEVVAAVGSLFLSVTGWFVAFSGSIFSFLVERIVVSFGNTLEILGMNQGIDIVWTAFRDLANILIIGMFVFIAISIILGIKAYGERKMIARVLVVAVLINFSLLFTKIIIDGANFTAYQFYQASSLSATTDAGSGSSVPQQAGIGEQFLYIMGITTF